MADSLARFETADNQGSTLQESGTVGLTPVSVPSVSGPPISEFLIHVPEDQQIDGRLLVSTDGTNFLTLYPSGHLAWTPKGQTVTQLTVKGNQANVKYEIIMNLEVD